MEGLRQADDGGVVVAGVDVRRDPQKVKGLIGVQLQSSAFFANLNLVEPIELFYGQRPRAPAKGRPRGEGTPSASTWWESSSDWRPPPSSLPGSSSGR
jgi:hypothetical protein